MHYTEGDLEDQNRELRESRAILEAENIALKAQLERLQANFNDTSALAERGESERTRTLSLLNEALLQKRQLASEFEKKEASHRAHAKGLHYPQTKITESNDKEIVAFVVDLNQQILAIATDCVECILSKGYAGIPRHACKAEGDKALLKEVAIVIGDSLLSALTKVNHYQTPTVLRIAIQTALANQLYEFSDLWPAPYSHSFGDDFWKLWNAMKINEGLTAAAQWRSLSLKYIRSELILEAQLHDESVNASIRAISKILRAARVPQTLPELIKQCRTELGPSIDCLWKSAGLLAQKVKEECTADYQLVFSNPGDGLHGEVQTDWVSRTDRAVRPSNMKVACTTYVGVRRELENRRPGFPPRSLILSKATVILDQEVSEMLPLISD